MNPDGTVVVPIYDWTDFFATRFKKITGVKKVHHLRFSSSEPGVVYTKQRSDWKEEKVDINKDNVEAASFPEVVQPKGLPAKRLWYLYDQIRPFCPPEDRDTTCPYPLVPRADSRQGTPNPSPQLTPEPSPEPARKRRRVCAVCKQSGHNKRTCPTTS